MTAASEHYGRLAAEARQASATAEDRRDMVKPRLTVYSGPISPDCLCIWRSGVDALELDWVDPACPLHGPGKPFDVVTRYQNLSDNTVADDPVENREPIGEPRRESLP